jgi:acyl-CoA thioesterase-1
MASSPTVPVGRALPSSHSHRPASYTLAIAIAALLSGSCAKPLTRETPPPAAGGGPAVATSAAGVRGWMPERYVAIGDSFTIGTGLPPDRSFPARLQSRWPAVTLLNLGVNGYTTDDVVDHELPRGLGFRPDFATLAIGANDIVHGADTEAYRAGIRTILAALATTVPLCHVLALPQPDWSQSPGARAFGSPEALGAQIRTFNAILREEAVLHGARYLDLFPLMRRQADARMLAVDGLHPSAAAHDAWAEAIDRALETDPLPAACAQR